MLQEPRWWYLLFIHSLFLFSPSLLLPSLPPTLSSTPLLFPLLFPFPSPHFLSCLPIYLATPHLLLSKICTIDFSGLVCTLIRAEASLNNLTLTLYWCQKWDHNRFMGQAEIDDHICYRNNKAVGFIISSGWRKSARKNFTSGHKKSRCF